MIPEISILRLFLNYENWLKFHDLLAVGDFPKELQPVVRLLYAKYDCLDEGSSNLSVSDLANLFFAGNPSNREYMEGVFTQLEKDDSKPETTLELIQGIRIRSVLQELSMAAYDASQGKKKLEDVQQFFERLKSSEKEVEEDEFQFVSTDLDVLAAKTITGTGLRWRLATLNKMLGSLRKGNFGFIFARPETGKTTFLASEVTFMAEQADGPVLWLNNEEVHENVMLRCYQAALGVQTVDLIRDIQGNRQKFLEVTKGNIKMPQETSLSKQYVEKVCAKLKPALIVIDQIDKITGFQADREDLMLGDIYQWARELAKQYGPVIAVCQADGSGEGQKWLTMANVANAKTSKQAEADWIIGIGKINDPGYDALRFLHASKNKLMGDQDSDPTLRHGRKEVIIDAHLARYRDIE